MDYVNLGSSGLRVSQICLGCMTFGQPDRGTHEWTLTEDDSRPIIKHAIDAGINFFDAANSYSAGSSEEIVGRALKSFVSRDDVVIATKVFHNGRPSPYEVGLSRKAIMAEVDASLQRLGTDYIDLDQTHRWDYTTPIAETMEALQGGQGPQSRRLVDVRLTVLQSAVHRRRQRVHDVHLDAGPLQPSQPRGGT